MCGVTMLPPLAGVAILPPLAGVAPKSRATEPLAEIASANPAPLMIPINFFKVSSLTMCRKKTTLSAIAGDDLKTMQHNWLCLGKFHDGPAR